MEDKPTQGWAKELFKRSSFAAFGMVVAISSVIGFATVLHGALNPAPDPTATPSAVASVSETAGSTSGIIPAELTIPSLNINSNVEETGITAAGAMGTPTSFSTTAWYEYGPEPGQPGMALIDGHVNNGLGLAGVFVNLDQIKIGADIYIMDSSGNKLDFVVVSTSTVPYVGTISEITATQSTTQSQLVLITCEGNWVPSSRTYDHRIVVLAGLR